MSEDSDISYIGEKHVQASFLFERLLAHIQYRSFVCSIGLYDCDLKGRAGACKTRPTKASDVSAYFDIRVGLLDRGFELREVRPIKVQKVEMLGAWQSYSNFSMRLAEVHRRKGP